MTVVLAVGLLLIASATLFFSLNRPRLVVITADLPGDFPASGFSHSSFESLMTRFVDARGDVDYARWHASDADRRTLDEYLAAVSAYSPLNTADRFPKRSDALAYWLNAYNAYVIHSVLVHWPLESVTDLRAPLEVTTGFGFFWQQRFVFGGEPMSLYAVENDIIREQFRDPRIHFVLNCASESCPVARPELPTGSDLEPFLQQAAVDFVSYEKNVRVDHARRRVVLSDIFKWYEKDFANELRKKGKPSGRPLIDYLLSIAPSELAGELAKAENYAIEFSGYDWALNDADSA